MHRLTISLMVWYGMVCNRVVIAGDLAKTVKAMLFENNQINK